MVPHQICSRPTRPGSRSRRGIAARTAASSPSRSARGAEVAGERLILSLIRDITKRREAQEALKEADRRKDDFLAVLAHELRNPLAPIRNAVHVMKLIGPGDADLCQARDVIDRQVTHLARLVDDLLDVSRISRGKVLLRAERLDLVPLVRTAVGDHRPLLESTGLRLVVDLPDRPIWVQGDPTRLLQVAGNLLQNARKFTDPGGTVTVRLAAEPDGAAAILAVRDTGIGMDERDAGPSIRAVQPGRPEPGPQPGRAGPGAGPGQGAGRAARGQRPGPERRPGDRLGADRPPADGRAGPASGRAGGRADRAGPVVARAGDRGPPRFRREPADAAAIVRASRGDRPHGPGRRGGRPRSSGRTWSSATSACPAGWTATPSPARCGPIPISRPS